MHPRVGMTTEYLSEEFMGYVKNCVEKAREKQMLAWIYDEDKWPSGYAGGFVTKNHQYRQRFLLFTPFEHSYETALRDENSRFLAKYDVELDEDGYLTGYRQISVKEQAEHDTWFAILKVRTDEPRYNGQAYVDALNKNAISEFIRVTHERYKQVVGKHFGSIIPAVFTDEPQIVRKENLNYAHDKTEVIIPFTDDLEETYQKEYGESLLYRLPELFWELREKISVTRYRYHDHLAERFALAFADNIGKWCRENGLMLTGHLVSEGSLRSQTRVMGDAMRSYRSFQLPGIDILCDDRELNTAKQAASSAHQYGCPGVMSELYGVTNWNFDFRGHKLQGDWQAALGITVRVPHHYWVSMGGEAKRDYPASIGHQSPWYKEYPFVEDHFARVNTLMTRGKPECRIGVLHPVESFWLHFGPKEQTEKTLNELDRRFSELTRWLILGTLDFDFISESLLKNQFVSGGKGFTVGQMAYDVVLVPNCETLRASTLDALENFSYSGGHIIFAGTVPRLIDAVPSDRPQRLIQESRTVNWSQTEITDALEPFRIIDIRDRSGARSNNLAYGLRSDGNRKYLFVAHVYHREPDFEDEEIYKIKMKGEFIPELYDTIDGTISPLHAEYVSGWTVIDWRCYAHSSILLGLKPGRSSVPVLQSISKFIAVSAGDEVPVSLDEPNVLLLDAAEWSLDGGEWNGREEMLRLTDKIRGLLGFSTADIQGCQPWAMKVSEDSFHSVRLKYTFKSQIEVDNAFLALENISNTSVLFNGTAVNPACLGKYVDDAIDRIPIPVIRRGINVLELTVPFGRLTGLENCFILGDFGVLVEGNSAEITSAVRSLRFEDWTRQGLPFYGGNVVYHITVNGNGGEYWLQVGRFEAPVIAVDLEKKRIGRIAIAPYTLELGTIRGEKTLDVKVFGSRINTFGALHNANDKERWYGPNLWRTTGNAWSDEYRLTPCGLLSAPRLLTTE